MRNEWNVWVVGGDLRQVRLAQLLHEEGHTVHTWALEGAEDPDERGRLEDRIRLLSVMLREARELAVLTERYYDRGYRRNVRYTI